jgi:hypothetical protein
MIRQAAHTTHLRRPRRNVRRHAVCMALELTNRARSGSGRRRVKPRNGRRRRRRRRRAHQQITHRCRCNFWRLSRCAQVRHRVVQSHGRGTAAPKNDDNSGAAVTMTTAGSVNHHHGESSTLRSLYKHCTMLCRRPKSYTESRRPISIQPRHQPLIAVSGSVRRLRGTLTISPFPTRTLSLSLARCIRCVSPLAIHCYCASICPPCVLTRECARLCSAEMRAKVGVMTKLLLCDCRALALVAHMLVRLCVPDVRSGRRSVCAGESRVCSC